MDWIKINSEADLPKRKGDGRYEQQDCLIFLRGQVVRAVWNCEHLVWDDQEGDDFYCNPLDPIYYLPIEPPGAGDKS